MSVNSMIEQLLDGRYQVTQILARGGFGQTYLAVDTRRPGQPICVVKQLRPIANNLGMLPTLHRLFNTEAETLERLGQHDQIPRLLAYFEENQEFYLMQEFISGHSLDRELVPQRSLDSEQVIDLLRDILEILVFVHSQGVIHRDIKPANIIRRQTDQKLVLIDFGAVKELRTVDLDQPNVTVAVGTPGYTPTEQFRGYPQFNSDIYAVGIIGVQAATGLPIEVIQSRIDPNHPSAGIEHWHTGTAIDPRLMTILDRMIHPDYRQRYRSAASVLSDLYDLSGSIGNSNSTIIIVPDTATPLSPSLSSRVLEPLQSAVSHVRSAITTTVTKRKRYPALIWLLAGAGVLLAGISGIHHLPHHPRPIAQMPSENEGTSETNSPSNYVFARTLSGHSDEVWAVTLSADGQTLVSGSKDSTLKIWNSNTGQLNRTIDAQADFVRSICLSLDQQTLVSSDGENTIKVWNFQTGTLRYILSGHSAPVWSVVLSRDGQTLISGSEDGTIKVWNLQTGRLTRTLTGHTDTVYAVALSPDQQTIVSGSADQTVKVWNLETGELIRTLRGHNDVVRSVALSSNGQTIASASWDRTIKIWNLQSGKLLRTLKGHSDRVVSVEFSSDGRSLVSGGLDKTVRIWNPQTGELLQSLSGHSDWVLSVATQGQTIVSGSRDQTIKVWQ